MPYCIHCGTQVAGTAAFCHACGAAQPQLPAKSPLDRLDPRTASILCYIPLVGWIACIVVLAAEKFRTLKEVRFHAFQGLYIFVAWLIVDWGIEPFFQMLPRSGFRLGLPSIMKVAIIGIWVYMIVQTSQNRLFRLPVFGELAERSLSDQPNG